jgi:hypothetical protein
MPPRALEPCRGMRRFRTMPKLNLHLEDLMKTLTTLMVAAGLLSGCISSSSPPPPAKTTVVVPANSTTTVVCQDGTKPPCN